VNAEEEYNQLLKEPRPLSDKMVGYRALSLLYAYLGKYKKILEVYDKIIAIDQKSENTNRLTNDYAAKAFWLVAGWNDWENAKKLIEKGLELKETAGYGFYLYLFELYLMRGEYEKASALAENQLALYYPFSDVVSAYSHRARGEYEAAIKYFLTLSQRGLHWQKVIRGYDLARCYFETGQNEKAIEAVQRIQRIYINTHLRAVVYPKSFYLLGKIYEKKGDKQLAVESYEKFLNIWKEADQDLPDLIEAKARVTKLKAATK
jgi:tetratricopeptide (TPR) repeat protein